MCWHSPWPIWPNRPKSVTYIAGAPHLPLPNPTFAATAPPSPSRRPLLLLPPPPPLFSLASQAAVALPRLPPAHGGGAARVRRHPQLDPWHYLHGATVGVQPATTSSPFLRCDLLFLPLTRQHLLPPLRCGGLARAWLARLAAIVLSCRHGLKSCHCVRVVLRAQPVVPPGTTLRAALCPCRVVMSGPYGHIYIHCMDTLFLFSFSKSVQ
jgi:hypothetical protein